jgi:hypothetical protein
MNIKPDAIIVDIDGTLANVEHRRHFLNPDKLSKCCNAERCYEENSYNIYGFGSTNRVCTECGEKFIPKKPDWKSFNEAMVDDTPNKWCTEIINNMCKYQYDLFFLSGREEEYRELTVKQIYKWLCMTPSDFSLFMRPTKDYRSDVEIKREIYEKEIKDKYNVLFCLDDRQSIVDLWRELGLVCLQCDEGNF